MIRQVKETITAVAGKIPKGWLSPGLAETFSSPDHLAAEGFEYVCDWACDDQPVSMRVQQGRMIALPVHSTISDIVIFLRANECRKITFTSFGINSTRFTGGRRKRPGDGVAAASFHYGSSFSHKISRQRAGIHLRA